MVKVPTADGFGVLPGVRQGQVRPVLSQDEAMAPGRRMEQAGQQMGAIGRQLGDFALQEQEKVNKARLNDAYNQAEQLAQSVRGKMQELRGAAAAKGINGKPLDQYFFEELNRGLSTIADDLPATVVRDQFGILADDLATRFRGDAMGHLAEQSAIYQKNIRDTTAVQSFNAIASDPFKPGVVNFNLARARDAYTETFREAGFDESSGLNEQVKGAMGKSHSVVIDTLLEQGQGIQAQKYFEQHRNDFNAVDAEAVEAKVAKGASASQALVDVDAVLGEFDIQGDNIPRAAMDARLRTIVGDDPVRLKAARDEISVRMNLYETEYKNQYADNYNTSLEMARTSPARAYASPAFQALDAKDQETIRSFVTGKDDEARGKRQDTAYYDLAFDAKRLASMSDADFRAMRPKVGERNFALLLKMRQDMTKDPTLTLDAEVDAQVFTVLADEFGYKDAASGKDKVQAARLRKVMEDAISLKQNQLGRKLSREEKDSVIRQTFSYQIGQPFKLFQPDTWGSTGVKDLAMATPEEIARSNLVAEVPVPELDRAQITEMLQIKGAQNPGNPMYAVTDENIVRFYLMAQGVPVAQ
jgi:hypothetical protein